MKTRSIQALVLAVVLVMGANAAVLAGTITRSAGPVTRVQVVSDDHPSYTDGATFSDVPGMRIVVHVPDGERAILVVTFSATSVCHDADGRHAGCEVRAKVDGQTVAPGAVIFDHSADGNSTSGYEAQTMTFTSPPQDAGSHVVTVQYRVNQLNAYVQFEKAHLTVLRARM